MPRKLLISFSSGLEVFSRFPLTLDWVNGCICELGSVKIIRRFKKVNGNTHQIPIHVLITNGEIRSYILGLCKRNNFHAIIDADLEELVNKIKKKSSAIVVMDYQVVNNYGSRIYSRINVACPGCNAILLCDRDHRDIIKQAVELGVYACILAPYEEWEVLTMIRNIIAKKKMMGRKEPNKNKEIR